MHACLGATAGWISASCVLPINCRRESAVDVLYGARVAYPRSDNM
jgi:hypothetical protein